MKIEAPQFSSSFHRQSKLAHGKQSTLADHQQGRQAGGVGTTMYSDHSVAAHQGKVGARILGRGAFSAPAQPFSFLPAGPPSPCCSQESKVNWDELSAAGGDIWPVSTPCEEVETYLYCRHISRATRPPRAPPSR